MLRQPPFAKTIPTFCSTVSVAGNNALGILGSYNWEQEIFPSAEMISGNDMVNRGLRVGHKACAGCIARSAIINEKYVELANLKAETAGKALAFMRPK